MEDEETKDGVDQVRVVEDGPEEVIRLDSPKKVKLEKRGEVIAAKIEARHLDEVEAMPEKEVRAFDPEENWKDETEADDEKSVPMGWFYLLGAGLLGVLFWVGFQNSTSPEKLVDSSSPVSGISPKNSGVDQPLGKIAEDQAAQDAEEHFANTERVVTGFLKAATIEEKLKFVRHSARVKPLMESHYSRHELKPVFYKKISTYQVFPLENRPFLALSVKDEDGEDHAILLEDGAEGLLVDWESFVCFQPVELESYARDRPSESTVLRAYVKADYYHSRDFESSEEYASFRLSFRGSDLLLNGYVKRGTELDQRFRKIFPDRNSQTMKPLVISVRFLEGGRSPRSVMIEGLDSILWAFANDPAEVASSEESR